MANYTLQLDLLGGEKVEAILQRLQALTGSLKGGAGSVLGGIGSSNAGIVTQRDVTNMEKIKYASKETKKNVMDAATALSQGANTTGKAWISKALASQSSSFIKANPHLFAAAQAAQDSASSSSSSGTKRLESFKVLDAWGKALVKTLGDDAKAMDWYNSAVKRAALSNDNFTKGLKEPGGKDLAKAIGMGAFGAGTTKGLRDVGGADLAKVQEMGDINDIFNTGKMHGPDLNGKMRKKWERDATTFKKDMSFLMMPMFNPGSMWATLFSARQTYSAMNTEHGKAFLEKNLGGMGAGKGTALMVGAATAAGLALMGLKKIIGETIDAYKRGQQLYSHAMQTGLGLKFSTQRQTLAQIMGVSEQDVFRFGAQMDYLNPKIERATKILADTAVPLTQVSWEWQVMKVNLQAVFSKMAADAQPAMMKFIVGLEILTKAFSDSLPALEKVFNIVKWGNPLYAFHRGTEALANSIYGVNQSQVDNQFSSKMKMPSPQSWMKQLPASHWEKMGLVVGGGSNNYAKGTYHNTKSMANDLRKMVKYFTRDKAGNVTSSHFGMSAFTANP